MGASNVVVCWPKDTLKSKSIGVDGREQRGACTVDATANGKPLLRANRGARITLIWANRGAHTPTWANRGRTTLYLLAPYSRPWFCPSPRLKIRSNIIIIIIMIIAINWRKRDRESVRCHGWKEGMHPPWHTFFFFGRQQSHILKKSVSMPQGWGWKEGMHPPLAHECVHILKKSVSVPQAWTT